MQQTAANKQLIEEYLAALSGRPKTRDVIERYVTGAALIDHINQAERGFPAYRLTARQMLAEGDWVAVRATFAGTHQGEFAGVPATGRRVEAEVIILYRIEAGHIAEHHLQLDTAGLLGQLQERKAS